MESTGDPEEILKKIRSEKPYPHAYIEIDPAKEAFKSVLANAGATLPRRDAVDERVIGMVRSGKVGYTKGKGIITDVAQVGGYPDYRGESYKDTDGDGMADEWEFKYGLDRNDPRDASADLNANGYTNIEEFINKTDPDAKAVRAKVRNTYVDLWGSAPDLRSRLERK